MPKTPIIEKIKKLLALAGSNNEHEAALAAAHVVRLLAQHNLAMADIEASHHPDKAEKVETFAPKVLPKWLRILAGGVSSGFDCQAVHIPSTGKMTFIGVNPDALIAAYTFSYLNSSVRRLCGVYMKETATSTMSNRNRELQRQSFYLGAAFAISAKMREQKGQTPVTTGALVLVKTELIKRAMEDFGHCKTTKGRKSYVDAAAFAKGSKDGNELGVHRGVGMGRAAQGAIGE